MRLGLKICLGVLLVVGALSITSAVSRSCRTHPTGIEGMGSHRLGADGLWSIGCGLLSGHTRARSRQGQANAGLGSKEIDAARDKVLDAVDYRCQHQ